jgi:hypothetical protein
MVLTTQPPTGISARVASTGRGGLIVFVVVLVVGLVVVVVVVDVVSPGSEEALAVALVLADALLDDDVARVVDGAALVGPAALWVVAAATEPDSLAVVVAASAATGVAGSELQAARAPAPRAATAPAEITLRRLGRDCSGTDPPGWERSFRQY